MSTYIILNVLIFLISFCSYKYIYMYLMTVYYIYTVIHDFDLMRAFAFVCFCVRVSVRAFLKQSSSYRNYLYSKLA